MTFSLAGLLRVRGTQERVAAERLTQAAADRVRAESARDQAESSLSDLDGPIDDTRTLLAMAAARAAGSSALSELTVLAQLRREDERLAKAAHIEARRELRGLERLESAHISETAKAQLNAEQVALDEIAIARSRGRNGSAA
jgi:flagellar FliJ protein